MIAQLSVVIHFPNRAGPVDYLFQYLGRACFADPAPPVRMVILIPFTL
ncbi:hypothetical protein [Pseudomonas phage ZRG1]|nr:hypothetical protein [Pseudomonas phage ZRG1]